MARPRKMYWLAQLGGWGLLAAFVFLASFLQENDSSKLTNEERITLIISSCIVFYSVGILISHSMRFVYLRLGILGKKLNSILLPVILITLVASVILTIIFYFESILLNYLFQSYKRETLLANLFAETISHFIIFTLWNGVYFTFHYFQKSNNQEMLSLQLEASHNEIELKNLRSQLNPHFLFNSLNTVRALVEIDPQLAKTNITKLSNLLRKSLVVNDQLITLAEELTIVQDYVDLEKVRFEERVNVELEHNPDLDDFKIPPFIIQTLVENAFKHGIARRVEGGKIWISTKKESDGTIVLMVTNQGALNTISDSGIGVQNTKRRLELQYKGNASFNLSEENDCVLATIEIKNQQ
jgi:two-component system, LytTR family, sensor kinase